MKEKLQMLSKGLRDVAVILARMHTVSAPEIKEIYLFPSPPGKEEIRLVELDPTTSPSKEMVPYYFNPDPANGIRYVSAIVLIRPEEKKRLKLPTGWGSWVDAEKIWPGSSQHK